MKSITTLAKTLLVIGLPVSLAQAGLLLEETFNYTLDSNIGAAAVTGTGQTGAWQRGFQDTLGSNLMTYSSSWSVPAGYGFTPAARAVGTPVNETNGGAFHLAAPIDFDADGTVYFSYLLKYTDGDDRSRVSFGSSSAPDLMRVQGIADGTLRAYAGGDFNPGAALGAGDFLVVGRITTSAVENDDLRIWVYASTETVPAADPGTTGSYASRSAPLTGTADMVEIRNLIAARIGELRMGTTWQSVVNPVSQQGPVLLEETFNYTLDTANIGSAAVTGTGQAGVWQRKFQDPLGSNLRVYTSTWTIPPGYGFTPAARAVGTPVNETNGGAFHLAAPIDFDADGTVYFSYLLKYTDGDDRSLLGFGNSASATALMRVQGIADGTLRTYVGGAYNAGIALGGGDFLVVGRIITSAAGDDSLRIWVYASTATVPAADPGTTGSYVAFAAPLTGSADMVEIRNLIAARIGELRMGTTWESVITPAGAEVPVPVISLVVLAGSDLEIYCESVTGFAYNLEYSTDLAGWGVIDSQPGNSGTLLFIAPAPASAGDRKFYRISAALPE